MIKNDTRATWQIEEYQKALKELEKRESLALKAK